MEEFQYYEDNYFNLNQGLQVTGDYVGIYGLNKLYELIFNKNLNTKWGLTVDQYAYIIIEEYLNPVLIKSMKKLIVNKPNNELTWYDNLFIYSQDMMFNNPIIKFIFVFGEVYLLQKLFNPNTDPMLIISSMITKYTIDAVFENPKIEEKTDKGVTTYIGDFIDEFRNVKD